MIRVILAEDHNILRDGLKSIFKDEAGIVVSAEVSNGEELIKVLETIPAEVILMDINMPVVNGIEATAYVTQNHPQIKVLALSMLDHPRYLEKILEAGAKGYVLKNAGKSELIHAIKVVADGGSYICRTMYYNAEERLSKGSSVLAKLTKRELEILKLLAFGYSNKEIAEKLFISRRTVESHRMNLIEKTNSKNSFALLRFAIDYEFLL